MKKTLLSIATILMALIVVVSCKKKDEEDNSNDPISVQTVSLDQTSYSLAIGGTVTLTASIYPETATNKSLVWTSDNVSVATASGSGTTCTVTAVSEGTANITVFAADDASISAKCVITVSTTVKPVVTVKDSISVNTIWTSDNIYLIKGYLYVTAGAKLTIQAGTIVKGEKASKGTLIVERGGKIEAIGTSTNPIVMTSDQAPGERTYGDWGGLIICGKAQINVAGGQAQVEGGPRSYYGGTDDADNSGTLQYVRIEFAGIPLVQDKETNGLTLGAVGSGTTIDHIQVSYCGDDSYEWFGGTVNCKYLVAFRGWDDEFDTDYGFRGKIQFAIGLRDALIADASTSNGFESDNDGSGSNNTPVTKAIFSNVSLFGPKKSSTTDPVNSNYGRGLHLRRNTKTSLYNSIVVGWPTGVYIDGFASQNNATNDDLQIRNTIIAGNQSNFGVPPSSTVFVDAAALRTWFSTSGWGNDTLATVADLQISNPYNYTAPNFKPATDSPVRNKADFTNTNVSTFFDQVTFVGAMGDTDWTAGWCNWTPIQTIYQ